MATKQTATWNRDDRDLLVELRTTMQNVQIDITSTRAEIKDISTGMTARLLNLEGNSVSKVEIKDFDTRISSLEASSNNWIGKQQFIAGAIGVAAGLLGSLLQGGHI